MLHKDALEGDIHRLNNWGVANEAALDALTLTAADEGKLVWQQDTNEFFFLADYSVPTWLPCLGVVGPEGPQGDQGDPGVNSVLLNENNAYTQSQTVVPVVATDGATITLNCDTTNNHHIDLPSVGAARVLANPTGLVIGMAGIVRIKQGATSVSTMTYGNLWKFPNGMSSALTPSVDAIDLISFYYDGSVILAGINKAYA